MVPLGSIFANWRMENHLIFTSFKLHTVCTIGLLTAPHTAYSQIHDFIVKFMPFFFQVEKQKWTAINDCVLA